jgi:hypothetical protein
MAPTKPSSPECLSVVDETTPLLIAPPEPIVDTATAANGIVHDVDEDGANGNGDLVDDGDEEPLPLGQIALLCFARMVEPIAFFSIFPFINKMIFETGNVRKEDVGFYSGLIVSLRADWGAVEEANGI